MNSFNDPPRLRANITELYSKIQAFGKLLETLPPSLRDGAREHVNFSVRSDPVRQGYIAIVRTLDGPRFEYDLGLPPYRVATVPTEVRVGLSLYLRGKVAAWSPPQKGA